MKIFVTGGTGYIGQVLVAEGVALGYEMVVLTRSLEKIKDLQEMGAQTVVGDLNFDGDWIDEMNACDAVIHLAAPPTWGKKVTKKVAQQYADGHYQLTQRLFNKLDPQKIKKVIFVGGTSFFGDAGKGQPKEETYLSEPKGWGPYIAPSIHYAKSQKEKFDLNIVYPSQIYGPSSWLEQLFLEPLYNGKPLTSLKGYAPIFSPIHIEDCGRALIHLIKHGQAGEEYILTDHQPLPSEQFRKELERLMNVTNSKVRFVPKFLCQLIIGPVLTEYATANTNFSNEKLLATGFHFRYPTYKDGLPSVVEQWLHLKQSEVIDESIKTR